MPDQAPTQPLRQADFSTRKKHLEYLERLANINQLQELLNNHEVRMAMGIPVGDLARLMHDPNMHGTQGLERVKKLIDYGSSSTQIASEEQAAPERAVSAHQQRSPQSAPATKTSVPGSGLRQQQTTVAQHTAAAQPQKAYAAPSNGDGPPRPINRAGGQLSGPSQAGATGLNRIPAPATASEQGAHVGATPPAGGGAQVLNGASADGAASKRVSIRDVLNQQRIFLPSYAPGTYRALCPRCKGGSAGEQSFSITVDEQSKSAIWNCFRSTCGYSGNAHVDKPARVNDEGYFVTTAARKRKEEPPVRPIVKLEPLTPEMLEFFAARGISAETLRRNGVASELVYDPGLKKQARVIAFPYYRWVPSLSMFKAKQLIVQKRNLNCRSLSSFLFIHVLQRWCAD